MDYVLGMLVFDNFAVLRAVVMDCVADRTKRAHLLSALDAAEQHVKFSYVSSHAGTDDSDSLHDSSFALSTDLSGVNVQGSDWAMSYSFPDTTRN